MSGAFFVLLVAYIMGSFPMGLWVGQVFFKKDIRVEGSSNIGATNAYRILGPSAGVVVFLGDFLKGAAPVIIMKSINLEPNLINWLAVGAGMFAMLGHTFSIFLKFKGGKGVTTALGAIIVLAPKVSALILLIWLVVLAISRYISLSSITAALALPVFTIFWQGQNTPFMIFSFLIAIVIIYKHRSNIGRLFEGVEPRVGS
ncbi:MAG: glycerol-3-phosphate 1-O-acyltransferase PlsY [Actinobacteria bacterium]|nr:MAG: glycerol-3-phosphate 1-O-acyltransferase PlsY [Actinomycetota bacterium]